MSSKLYWRRSIMASGLVHCLIFVGTGWFNAQILDASHAPEYMEMELISDIAATEQAANTPAEQLPATRQPKPAATAVASNEVAENVVSEQTIVPTASSNSSVAAVPVMAAPAGVSSAGTASAGSKRISAPRVLNKVEPAYPEEARQDGFDGTVAVRIEILENGRPGEVRIERSSGRRSLDEAALQAVRQWRFVPAQETDSGRAVRCFTTLPIVFRLQL